MCLFLSCYLRALTLYPDFCSDEQKSVKKNLVKFGTRYIRFMLRACQLLKLLSDACIESRSVACVFYSTVVKNNKLTGC